jgi:hypothetical protein
MIVPEATENTDCHNALAEVPMEERHIAQFEMLVTKQELLLIELERDGHVQAAALVRDRLAAIEGLLRFAWERHGHLSSR